MLVHWPRVAAIALSLCLVASPAAAHPGAGLVVDRAGRIFFVRIGDDRIWTLENGKPAPYLSDPRIRRPHRLILDTAGNMYTASDDDGRVWRIAPDRSISLYFESKDKRLQIGAGGDPFDLDAAGDIVGTRGDNSDIVIRVTRDGHVSELGGRAKIAGLHYGAIVAGPDGSVYATGNDGVFKLTDGTATRVLSGGRGSRFLGLAIDSASRLHVADYGGDRVLTIDTRGASSAPPGFGDGSIQQPLGITIAPNGVVYVLAMPQDGFAIWKGGSKGPERILLRVNPRIVMIAVILTLITGVIALETMRRKPESTGRWATWVTFAAIVIAAGYYVGGRLLYYEHLRHVVLLLFLVGAVRSFKARRPA